MVHCPNCGKRISHWRLLNIGPIDNHIACSFCNSIIQSENNFFYNKKSILAWTGIILIYIAYASNREYFQFSIMIAIIGFIIILFAIIVFFRNIKLTIFMEGTSSPDSIFGKNSKNKINYSRSEKEVYELQFEKLSIVRLTEISKNNKWSKVARKVALELIDSRTKKAI